MNIKNETVYDKSLLNEAGNILSKKYVYVMISVCVFFIAFAVFNGIVYKGNVEVILTPLIGMVLVIIMGIFRVLQYKKTLIKRLETVNHKDNVSYHYVIDEEKIVATTENGTNAFYHKDVKKVHENKNLYIIIYSGAIFIILSKAGFEGQTDFDLKNMLQG